MSTIETCSETASQAPGALRVRGSRIAAFVAAFGAVPAWIENALKRRGQRRDLLELTDEQLKDIGISRSQAYREGLRQFWD